MTDESQNPTQLGFWSPCPGPVRAGAFPWSTGSNLLHIQLFFPFVDLGERLSCIAWVLAFEQSLKRSRWHNKKVHRPPTGCPDPEDKSSLQPPTLEIPDEPHWVEHSCLETCRASSEVIWGSVYGYLFVFLVCSGCLNKVPQTGQHTAGIYCLTVLEPRSLRSGCQ